MAEKIPWYVIFLAGVGVGFLLLQVLPTLKLGAPHTVATNEEKWEWKDYRGTDRTIIVTREVKE